VFYEIWRKEGESQMDKKGYLKQVRGMLVMIMVGTVIIGTTTGWSWRKKVNSPKITLPGGWVGADWTGSGKATLFDGFTDGKDMLEYASIVDGALKFDTAATPSISGGFGTPTQPFGKRFKTLIVIARVKAASTDTAAIDFDLKAAGYRQRVQLTKGNTIQIYGESGSVKYKELNLTDWHTYLITYTKTDAGLLTNIYIDGATIPTVTGTAPNVSEQTIFRMGDGSGSTGYSGFIDWVYYTTDNTVTPENLQLPPGVSLK
jgi:hypothetical protein